jgi:CheY-like chemotaxis protein
MDPGGRLAAASEPTADRVLAVDDHELGGRRLYSACAPRACPPTTATRRAVSPACSSAAAVHPPGVVLLDLDLGRDEAGRRVDGVRLVAPLRAAGLQVVILSGSADHARMRAGPADGAMACGPRSHADPGGAHQS